MIQFQKQGVTVFQSALFQTTSTVIEGDEFILVADPNWLPGEIEEIQQHVEQIRNEKELYLLFTHGDFDHIIGYRAFPGAKVIGSKGLNDHPDKQHKLDLIEQFDNEYYITRDYPVDFPNIDIIIEEDGQQLVIGGTTITLYLAPGHTHDGLFTVIEPMGIWIAGDYFSNFELPFLYDSAKAYLTTLNKADAILQSHSVKVLVPGHGQAAESKDEIKKRIEMAEDYLNRLILAVEKEDNQALENLGRELPFQSSFTAAGHAKNIAIIQKEFFKAEE